MNINPTHSAAVQLPVANELDHFRMRNCSGSIDTVISQQELVAASAVAHEQLAGHKFVGRDLVEREQLAELFSVRVFAGQKANPDRAVHQHHLDSCGRFGRGFAPAGNIFRLRFAPTQTPKTLVRRTPHQSFQADEPSLCPSKPHTRPLQNRRVHCLCSTSSSYRIIVPYKRAVCVWQRQRISCFLAA